MNIKELAEQANGEPAWPGGVAWTWDELEAFAKLVASKEREDVIQHLRELKVLGEDGAFTNEIRERNNT